VQNYLKLKSLVIVLRTMEATKMHKTSEKQINWVKQNYHQRGGREKQLIRYHFKIHPELDPTTYLVDLSPLERLIKLKEYHFQELIKRNTEKFNKSINS